MVVGTVHSYDVSKDQRGDDLGNDFWCRIIPFLLVIYSDYTWRYILVTGCISIYICIYIYICTHSFVVRY